MSRPPISSGTRWSDDGKVPSRETPHTLATRTITRLMHQAKRRRGPDPSHWATAQDAGSGAG
jgi:hypothetical protein